jgi:ribonuclease HII
MSLTSYEGEDVVDFNVETVQLNFKGSSINNIKSSLNEKFKIINDENLKDAEQIAQLLKLDERKSLRDLGEKLERSISGYNQEILRVRAMYDFDKGFGSFRYIAGVDEVGRGPVAGPIVSAAVILDLDSLKDSEFILNINDSKKLSERLRGSLSELIKAKAVAFSIAAIDSSDIDKRGIAWSNNMVLKMACEKLKVNPELVLSDGYAVKGLNTKNEFIIKGDSKSASIACASIIAKVFRDDMMKKYHHIYPQYGFNKHVGYGTKEHMDNILKYGLSPIHRRSFLTNLPGNHQG